jgi:hypothetical protein
MSRYSNTLGTRSNVNPETGATAVYNKGFGVDLFGRLKVSMMNPQFTYQNEYNKGQIQWVEKIAGTGAAAHDPLDSTVNLAVSAASDKIIRQTRKYFRYFSGKASQATMTFYTGAMTAGTIFRCGYFDDDNGVFFERDATTEYIVLRSSGVDQKKPKDEWNGNKFPGFDFDKSVIMQINLQWLGVGVAQVVFEKPDGEIIVAHDFLGSGAVESTYMRTANLPMRYEFEATESFAGDTATAKQICCAYGVEDGSCGEVSKYRHTANNGITPASVTTTKRAILAIRPKLLFNSLTNRADISLSDVDLLVGGQNIQYELVYNPTLTGTINWSSADDQSTVEYSTDVSAYSGGIVIQSGFAAAGAGNTRIQSKTNVQQNYPLGLDVDGADQTTFVLVARSFASTATVSAAFGFEEIY